MHRSRRPRYASPAGLGQAFNFDLLEANWRCGEYLRVITDDLADTQQHGASTTWVLSNHDVVRHATRYALPAQDDLSSIGAASAWLLSGGVSPEPDRGLGTQRARAATLLMLALPGSAYLYQGEELGLHEVADIPGDRREDPVFWRSGGAEKGRDGCRVPLPWTADGPFFGFSAGAAHLPQPAWFGPLSVQAQEHDSASTLALYRQALAGAASFRPKTWVNARHERAGALPPFRRLAVRDQLGPDCTPAAEPWSSPFPCRRPAAADTTAWIIPPCT